MKFIADLHIHSKYSLATSKDMDLEHIDQWARIKGVDVVGTGDFTHPLWYQELKKKLKDKGNGLYSFGATNFMLSSEVCNIFHDNGKLKKMHTMIFAPSFTEVEKINKELSMIANLMSDGRPVFTMPVKKIAEIVFSASEKCMLVPAHIWTPWFSMLGSNSGYDSVRQCFGEYSRYIIAAETGLSSDPSMNWRVSSLDKICLISNSDAHSPSKIGREANVFNTDLSYDGIRNALIEKDPEKFLYTVEFFPEEGKYHYDGHADCGVSLTPKEAKKLKFKCPKCKKPLTRGVMSRVEELADREEGFVPKKNIPFKTLIPLSEIVSQTLDKGEDTATVKNEYSKLVSYFGSEFKLLLDATSDDLSRFIQDEMLEAISRVRKGEITIRPGYDGKFGEVKIFKDPPVKRKNMSQIGLFN